MNYDYDSQWDDYQNNHSMRNNELRNLLSEDWEGNQIEEIVRLPHPDEGGKGKWVGLKTKRNLEE